MKYPNDFVGNIIHNNCLEAMKNIPDNAIDSIITDPPYGLEFMGKDWDKGVPGVIFWKEMLRVCKPGGYLLSFGGTRTFHRLACAIEDAGWELTDCLSWNYSSGFPKGLEIGKAIDDYYDVERKVIGQRQDILVKQKADLERGHRKILDSFNAGATDRNNGFKTVSADITEPATELAKQFDDYRTSLKPAWEPILMAMKPIDTTFAKNAIENGLAGLNIGGTRIPYLNEEDKRLETRGIHVGGSYEHREGSSFKKETNRVAAVNDRGRYPSNFIVDEEAAKQLDEQGPAEKPLSRFFYCAKPAKSEKGKYNTHPTVKPLGLMRYLCKLTKPPSGGIVLDPFCGSGSALIAARLEGRQFIGIELDKKYCEIALTRLNEFVEK
jgi:site-specific DNA-methyltransferase (adenine-specific)